MTSAAARQVFHGAMTDSDQPIITASVTGAVVDSGSR
jgi:hypothetical protein